jgi:Trypsin-like peptidase domain
VRFSIGFCLVLAFACLVASARAEPADRFLRIYAVEILKPPSQSRTGTGIYLGNGLVVTAAHVLGSAADSKLSVRFGRLEVATNIVKEGDFELEDLTLLSVDEQTLPANLRQLRVPLCQDSPQPDAPVVVAVPESTARSRIMSPELLPPAYRSRFSTVISDVATTGNSGSGVFDAKRKCLVGIMSRKIMVRSNPDDPHSKMRDLAKYFVPAWTIAEFIPAEYRF